VIDSESADPLPMVNIVVENTTFGAASDLDGFYRIDFLPQGIYTITASMLSYSSLSITDVDVRADELTRLNFSLLPGAIQLETITVTAKAAKSTVSGLLSSQKKAPTVSSGISSEQIAKSPDPRASDVLKRVTGLSVVDDKYVFVRGLSERYSNARLNESSLPSPEPDKRVVPFDIFPSNLLDNVVITKAFIPSLPGDFAGGCIQLTTKEFAEQLTARASVSAGYNSLTTFKNFKTYRGGGLDLLGFDDGTRAMPGIVEEASRDQKIIEGGQFGGGFTASEIEAFGEAFRNVWSPISIKAPADQSLSFSLGNQIRLFDRPLGFSASLTHKNSYSFRDEERFYYINGAEGLEARHHYQDFQVSKLSVLWGGVFNTSYKISPAHKIGIKTTYTRTADDEVRTYAMLPNRDHNLDEICTRLRWVERGLLSSELSGEHQIGLFGSRMNWRVTYSLATRDEPDTRETLYESDIGVNDYRLADESNSGSRFFSYLRDHNFDMGFGWKIPFNPVSRLPGKLEFGGNYVFKDREIDSRRFRFKPQDFNTVDIYRDPEEIFSPENIGQDGFMLEEDTRPTDNYWAEQIVGAGYLMVDLPLSTKIRFVGGARLEYSDQEVTTFDLFNPTAEPVIGKVQTTDVLPAVHFNYKLNDDMNLRVGFAQTVSRPSFRELSPFDFTDIGGHAVVGNPELKRASIRNLDVRWEWYTGFAENISIALFYKRFTNPIEKTLLNATELTSSWQNAMSAENYLGEFEIRQSLSHLASSLSNFTLTGNFSLVRSRVELRLGGMETTKKRPLQGQSPYVLNVMIEYDHPGLGTKLSVMYNVFGRRIVEVGIAGTPDIYEEPFHKVDVVLTQPLLGKMSMKFSGRNLLDPEVEFTQGGWIQRHFKRGRSFSLNMAYSF
jgi:outer membrane receptor protein involved in Fe transport